MKGLYTFLIVGAGLALLRMGLYFLDFPNPAMAQVVSLLVSAVFLAVPIFALYRAASDQWSAGKAACLLVIGVIVHIGCVLLARAAFGGRGFGDVALGALAQFGLMTWCVGLGALLACLIRDKNLLLPVAAFLAGFDIFLIFAPITPTKIIMQVSPQFFKNVTYVVPTFGAQELARIGPADFFILAMLFVVLFKFDMKNQATFRWIVPVLVVYLLVVLLLGEVTLGRFSLGMLPALLPIGLTVLLVNREEFSMTTQEKISTLVVCFVAIAMAVAAFVIPEPKPVIVPPTTQAN